MLALIVTETPLSLLRLFVRRTLLTRAILSCARRILQGKKTTLFSNFDQYKLPYPEMLRIDVSPRGRSAINLSGVFAVVCTQLDSRIARSRVLHMIVPVGTLDAICCDPPYGIRAGARKSAAPLQVQAQSTASKDAPDSASSAQRDDEQMAALQKVIADTRSTRIPKTQVYNPCDVINDLLDFAADVLKIGGYDELVFLALPRQVLSIFS